MVLKMHHIVPKCILFFKKFSGGYTPDPVQKGRGRRSEKERKQGGSGWESGQEGKGKRAGKRKWEGRCVPPLFLKPIAAPDGVCILVSFHLQSLAPLPVTHELHSPP
jgi:hypothetical protein